MKFQSIILCLCLCLPAHAQWLAPYWQRDLVVSKAGHRFGDGCYDPNADKWRRVTGTTGNQWQAASSNPRAWGGWERWCYDPKKAFSSANVNAGTDRITITGHGLNNQDPVFVAVDLGSTIPPGLSAGVKYYANVIDPNIITLSLTPGGDVVDITDTGSGSFALHSNGGAAVGIDDLISAGVCDLEVNCVRYDSALTRPWIQVVRGLTITSGKIQGYLLTAADNPLGGHPVWEFKDAEGNALSSPIIASGLGGTWDSEAIDGWSLIRWTNGSGDPEYVLSYNTIGTTSRETGFATCNVTTSPGLTTWTKRNTTAQGTFIGIAATFDSGNRADGYEGIWDSLSTATPTGGNLDATRGLFCGQTFYSSVTGKYYHITPRYSAAADQAEYELYRCTDPYFEPATRVYIGMIWDWAGTGATTLGKPITDSDTPRLLLDSPQMDIESVFATYGQAYMLASLEIANNWVEELWYLTRDFDGLTDATAAVHFLDNGRYDGTLKLPYDQGDAACLALWAPGQAGTMADISGQTDPLDLTHWADALDSNGLDLESSIGHYAWRTTPTDGVITRLNALTDTFTVDWWMKVESTATGYYSIVEYSQNGTAYSPKVVLKHHSATYSGIGMSWAVGGVSKLYVLGIVQAPGTFFDYGNWHRWTFVCNAGVISCYKDGARVTWEGYWITSSWQAGSITSLDLSALMPMDDVPNGGSLSIGSSYGTVTYNFDGCLDRVQIRNDALATGATFSAGSRTDNVLKYASSGFVVSQVVDLQRAAQPAVYIGTDLTPANTSIEYYLRAASSASDLQTAQEEFAEYSSYAGGATRYAQYGILMGTIAPTATPESDRANLHGQSSRGLIGGGMF